MDTCGAGVGQDEYFRPRLDTGLPHIIRGSLILTIPSFAEHADIPIPIRTPIPLTTSRQVVATYKKQRVTSDVAPMFYVLYHSILIFRIDVRFRGSFLNFP